MEYLIKLKIVFDAFTVVLSNYSQKEHVKLILAIIYWFIIAFLAYDFYKYGIATGNTTLLTLFIVILFLKLLKKYNKRREQKTKHSIKNREKDGYCDKCGIKVDINYGDAHKTLCKNCS